MTKQPYARFEEELRDIYDPQEDVIDYFDMVREGEIYHPDKSGLVHKVTNTSVVLAQKKEESLDTENLWKLNMAYGASIPGKKYDRTSLNEFLEQFNTPAYDDLPDCPTSWDNIESEKGKYSRHSEILTAMRD